jgi:hypothetical protein
MELGPVPIDHGPICCNAGKETDCLPLTEAEIVRRILSEVRRIFWPGFYVSFGGDSLPASWKS